MKERTRSQYSMLNMCTSVFGQVLSIALGFAARTVFIYTLGRSYLGISSLFENVLQVLSLTDLGLESAIVYSLYKPLQEKNEQKIASIMTLYKNAYRVIGLLILLAGLCVIPALPYLTKDSAAPVNLTAVYLLFLVQTASSYLLFAYRRTIFSADQRTYKPSLIGYVVRLLTVIVQILWLVLFRGRPVGYYGYLIIGVCMTVLTDVIVGVAAGKAYPALHIRHAERLPRHELGVIKKNVIGTAFYKVCGVMTNSTDNLLISLLVNVDTVGIYSNYMLIAGYIRMLLANLFDSVTGSVGNLFVTGTKEQGEFVFRCLCVMNTWLYGFCGVAFFTLANPFIQTVWLRDTGYLLPPVTVFLLFFYMILEGVQYSIKSYLTACGLYWRGKYRSLISVLINLAVSVVLGRFCGLNGILLGTVISYLATMFWYDPMLLYREVFRKPVTGYFVRYILRLAMVTGVALGMHWLCGRLPDTLGFFAVRVLLVLVVPNGVFFLVYCRTGEFAYLKKLVAGTLLRRSKKRT